MVDSATRSKQEDVVNALVEGDLAPARAAGQALGDAEFLRLLGMVAAAVVFRLWPEDPSPEEYPVFAERIASQIPDGSISPALVEAAVRGLLGEDELIRDIPLQDLISVFLLLIETGRHTVIRDSSDRSEVISAVLSELDDAG